MSTSQTPITRLQEAMAKILVPVGDDVASAKALLSDWYAVLDDVLSAHDRKQLNRASSILAPDSSSDEETHPYRVAVLMGYSVGYLSGAADQCADGLSLSDVKEREGDHDA